MKKATLIVLVLFSGLLTSQAQLRVSPGIRGGLNLTNLTNFGSSDYKSDYYIGGLIELKFNKYFTLQPELNYSRQGAKTRELSYDEFGIREEKYNLDYVTLGAVAKFHFGGQGFHVLAGPSVDIKTSDNFPNFSDLAGADLAFVGGLGYSMSNGLTFEARFKNGLIDIYGYEDLDNNDDDYYYYDDVILNYAFQFGVSYTF